MKISIITVCKDSQDTINRAINSVLSQSISSIEYIIIDGDSSDSTKSIIAEYLDHIDHYISEKDDGYYDALNKGIKVATGDIIGILNSDDVFSSRNVLKEVLDVYSENPYTGIVFGNACIVDKHSKKLLRKVSYKKYHSFFLRFGFMPAHTATFVKKSTYETVGLYSARYILSSDYDWFVRAFLIFKIHFKSLNTNLVYMDSGGMSTSGLKTNLLITKEINNILKSNRFLSFYFLILLRLPIKWFLSKLNNIS